MLDNTVAVWMNEMSDATRQLNNAPVSRPAAGGSSTGQIVNLDAASGATRSKARSEPRTCVEGAPQQLTVSPKQTGTKPELEPADHKYYCKSERDGHEGRRDGYPRNGPQQVTHFGNRQTRLRGAQAQSKGTIHTRCVRRSAG